jgi:oligopeptide/dipeptide ABC transporter ATP-binding protein
MTDPTRRALIQSLAAGTGCTAFGVPLEEIPGTVPSLLESGCRFACRCTFAEARCPDALPVLREVAPGHRIACHRVSDTGVPDYPLPNKERP